MTIPEFIKLKDYFDQHTVGLSESEAIALKKDILKKANIFYTEYSQMEKLMEDAIDGKFTERIDTIKSDLKDELSSFLQETALSIQKNLKPDIINRMIERVTVEKPQIVEINKVYNDSALWKTIDSLSSKVEKIKTPNMREFELGLRNQFETSLKNNIEILGMPDFRKLAMGLRGDIDDLRKIGVAAIPSGNVVGPASATDNAIVRFDSTTGKLIQNSSALLDDSGNIFSVSIAPTSGTEFLIGSSTKPTNTLTIGNGTSSTTQQNVTIQPTPIAGIDNTAGGNLILQGGIPTGSAIGGNIVFSLTTIGASGPDPASTVLAGFMYAPTQSFYWGSNNFFQVDNNGNILQINSLPYNFPSVDPGIDGVLRRDAVGNISLSQLDLSTDYITGNLPIGNIVTSTNRDATHFLRGDGSWSVVGNVTGPNSATDNGITRYDGTTGKLIQDSGITISDASGLTNRIDFTSLGELRINSGGDGLDILMIASSGTSNSSSGGAIELLAGAASTSGGNADGGFVYLQSGSGHGTGNGGNFTFTAGAGGATGNGGFVAFTAGGGGSTSGSGGSASFKAGSASAGNSDGGDLKLSAGTKSGSGTKGALKLLDPTQSTIGAILEMGNIATSSKTFTFLNTSGNLPSVTGTDRKTAQTAAVNLATYTVGASDASFLVSANILITTATTHNFTCTVTYTDEGNTSRTLTLNFSTVAGVIATTIVNTGGTVPYEGVPLHIRCKASTTIIIGTTGTFTTVTYNIEQMITQIN